jgi:glycosyltransferase involved in cell wall biosynthesis
MKAFWRRGRVLEMVDSSSAEADLIPVTAVIPVKNEAQSLPSWLAALDGFADIVVVDSGSTDETVAIAQEAGAKVIQFRWSGGFPKKRNWVLQTFPFRTRWVLFIDADEFVTPAFKAELRTVLNKSDVAGFWLNYRNHFLGRVPPRRQAAQAGAVPRRRRLL